MAEGKISSEWTQHLDKIAELYVEAQWSPDDIAKYLTRECGLTTTAPTVRKYLGIWKIKRFTREEELELLARQLKRCKIAGTKASFFRFGKPFPVDKINDFLDRKPETLPSNEILPQYLRVVESMSHINARNAEPMEDSQESTLLAGPKAPVGRKRDIEGVERHVQGIAVPSQPTSTRGTRSVQPTAVVSQVDGTEITSQPNVEEHVAVEEPEKPTLADADRALAAVKKLFQDLGVKEADIKAALSGTEKLREVVKKGKDRMREEEETTDLGPLHYAAAKNNAVIIKSLIDKKADVNSRGGKGWTASHIAAEGGHVEALCLLLAHPDVDIDAVDDDGSTPLIRAISGESPKCALLLIHKGADVDKDGPAGRSPLQLACAGRNMGTLVAEIITRTKKLNHQDHDGRTALHWAASRDTEDYCRMLIRADASLNIRDQNGRTAVHQACFECSAALLLEMVNKDNVDLTIAGNDQETVLHLLCQRELSAVAEAVVRKPGVDINAKTTRVTTPLILAVVNGSYSTAEMLIRHQADVSIHDQDMDTALTVAIQRGNSDIAQLLIDNDSPVDPQNKTPAHYRKELETTRTAQQVSSLLNNMSQRSHITNAPSLATSSVDGRRFEHGISPIMPPTSKQTLDPADIRSLVMQLVQESINPAYTGFNPFFNTGQANYYAGAVANMDTNAIYNGTSIEPGAFVPPNTLNIFAGASDPMEMIL